MEENASNRRDWLKHVGAGVLARGALSRLCHAEDVISEKNIPEPPAFQLPRARLVLFGGGIGNNKSIKERVQALGLTDAKQLPAEEYDPAGMYHELAKNVDFKDKTVVCFTASSDEPDASAENLKTLFTLLGAGNVITISNQEQANRHDYARILENRAALAFFCGGDQDRASAAYKDTLAHKALVKRALEDASFTIAGTSAGAAVMSAHMINGGDPEKVVDKMKSGLGLLHLIIDTHINGDEPDRILEKRPERLQAAVTKHSDRIGIGLDVATGIILTNGMLSVIGDGNAYIAQVGQPQKLLTQHSPEYHLGDHAAMPVPHWYREPELARAQGR